MACGVAESNDVAGLGELEFRSDFGRETPPPEEDEGNGRGVGDWLGNGLQDWTISGVDPDFPLTSPWGLSDDNDDDDDDDDDDGWLADGTSDESTIIHYLVECALAEGQEITKVVNGQPMVLNGRVGLAPEWATEPCDEYCQQWVSACLLARRNFVGQEVELWVEGDHPELGFGDDPDYTLQEGVFFGNLFNASTDDEFACKSGELGAQWTALWRGRTCVLDDLWCDLTVFDDCVAAGCQLSSTGLAAVDCQPDPAGPAYGSISVHVAPLGG